MGITNFFCSPKSRRTHLDSLKAKPRGIIENRNDGGNHSRSRHFQLFRHRCPWLGIVLFFGFTSCSDLKTRDEVNKQAPAPVRPLPKPPSALTPSNTAGSASSTPVIVAEITPIPSPTPAAPPVDALPSQASPKVGLILGPGGAKALAEIGVVQELIKAKVPIQSVVGIEMGALVGAVFAQKAQPFDTDWQFGKIKDVRDVFTFSKSVFGNSSFDELRINFACSSMNLKNGQATLNNRGMINNALPGCFASPPLSRPQGHRVADLTGLKKSIDYLRSKGIGYIVYVDVLSANDGILTGDIDDSENVYWNEIARTLRLEAQGADLTIQVPTHDYDMRDWNHRHELVKMGVETGTKSAADILKKLGL